MVLLRGPPGLVCLPVTTFVTMFLLLPFLVVGSPVWPRGVGVGDRYVPSFLVAVPKIAKENHGNRAFFAVSEFWCPPIRGARAEKAGLFSGLSDPEMSQKC